jgi:hypothetical protein
MVVWHEVYSLIGQGLMVIWYGQQQHLALTNTLNLTLTRYFYHVRIIIRSRDSVVGMATGYRLDNRGVGVQIPVGSRIFSSPCRLDRLLSNGCRGLFPQEAEQPGRETDHSPPVSAEVKKMWMYTPTPPYAFMA